MSKVRSWGYAGCLRPARFLLLSSAREDLLISARQERTHNLQCCSVGTKVSALTGATSICHSNIQKEQRETAQTWPAWETISVLWGKWIFRCRGVGRWPQAQGAVVGLLGNPEGMVEPQWDGHYSTSGPNRAKAVPTLTRTATASAA